MKAPCVLMNCLFVYLTLLLCLASVAQLTPPPTPQFSIYGLPYRYNHATPFWITDLTVPNYYRVSLVQVNSPNHTVMSTVFYADDGTYYGAIVMPEGVDGSNVYVLDLYSVPGNTLIATSTGGQIENADIFLCPNSVPTVTVMQGNQQVLMKYLSTYFDVATNPALFYYYINGTSTDVYLDMIFDYNRSSFVTLTHLLLHNITSTDGSTEIVSPQGNYVYWYTWAQPQIITKHIPFRIA